ncbi:MAG: shikimate dehydrogenase [Candidatus Woesearchaeota archaeon]
MKKIMILGDPVEHSLSPIMHNTAFNYLNLEKEFQYGKMRVSLDGLAAFVELIRMGNIYGASVTIPHKIAIKDYVDKMTKEAKLIGAVNTIYVEDDGQKKIVGHNTDGIGCLSALKEQGVKIQGKKVAIIGAGGAARAIAFTFALNDPKQISIINRTEEKAKFLAEEIRSKTKALVVGSSIKRSHEVIKNSDIIINTTSVGMKGHESGKSLIDPELLNSTQVVMDIIYIPEKTKLLSDAEEKGCKIINGVGMLVHQGAEAFKIWTGKNAPIEIMKQTVLNTLRL